MRFAFALAILVACNTPSSSDPTPAPATPAGSAKPAPPDPAVVQAVADMAQYTVDMMPIMIPWDGNCDAHIKRMLAIEPFVKSLRDRAAALSEDQQAEVKRELGDHRDEILAKVDAQLAAANMRRADIDKREAEIKAKCGADARYQDAMDRIGVFKAKSPTKP
jgi:hypothetical protein